MSPHFSSPQIWRLNVRNTRLLNTVQNLYTVFLPNVFFLFFFCLLSSFIKPSFQVKLDITLLFVYLKTLV